MLSLRDVSLRRGRRQLLAEVNLTLHAGQKLGLVGANGSGKSSLLALIRGELQPDAGEVALPARVTIASVAQETPAVEQAAIDYVIDGDTALRALQAALLEAEQRSDGRRIAELHGQIEAMGGYRAEARAGRLMAGLGFAPERQRVSVATLSGGWRMRLNLARALMCPSDLLLLDEPTNHLDLDAVLWLEGWLSTYPGTLLLISHDRDFLDGVVSHVALLAQERLTLYTGNYSLFEAQRAEQLRQQQAAHARQQREVTRIHRFVERFRAKASKARQVQSRLHRLERMEQMAPAHAESPFQFEFPAPDKLPNPLLRLEEVAAGYGSEPVLKAVTLSLLPDSRLGLLGPNGAGKSTLIRLLAGELPPSAGAREAAEGLAIGYFAQHQLEQLDPEASPLLHLQRLDPLAREQTLRDFLGGFGFVGDTALEPVAPFSGGEKARLVLALLVYRRPNLLLLDEPTNHLDLEMRRALTLALQAFEGAVVVVAHDRHLLESVCDDFALVADGSATPCAGGLEGYRRWLAERAAGARALEAPTGEAAHRAVERRDRRRQEAEQRARLAPLRRELQRTEQQVEQLSAEVQAVERALADPELYAAERKDELKQRVAHQAALKQQLAKAEANWLEIGERLEAEEKLLE